MAKSLPDPSTMISDRAAPNACCQPGVAEFLDGLVKLRDEGASIKTVAQITEAIRAAGYKITSHQVERHMRNHER